MSKLRLAMIAFGCATLGLNAPVLAQGFPPVPGPFLVAPAWASGGYAPQAAPMPNTGQPVQPAQPQSRPAFAPPANAMRVPYWMQRDNQPPQTAPTVGVGQTAPNSYPPATTGEAPTGYGQAGAPGTFPGYGATIPWGGAGQGGAGQVPPGVATNQPQAGWAPPGWARAPYAPGSGWGGWTMPSTGSGN